MTNSTELLIKTILGVAQLLNKNNGKPFTESDENLFEVNRIF